MRTSIKRCRHCQQTYTYHMSGPGCCSPLNDADYCPECMAKILEALKEIPVKFEARYRKMNGDNRDLISQFHLIKNKEEEQEFSWTARLYSSSVSTGQLFRSLSDDQIDGYRFERYRIMDTAYVLRVNEETNEPCEVYRLDEYDLVADKFTDKIWWQSYNSPSQFLGYVQKPFRPIPSEKVIVRPMEPPSGTLFYMDNLINTKGHKPVQYQTSVSDGEEEGSDKLLHRNFKIKINRYKK